ncbi:MAG: tRNA adenosine(34) deaminase TadA [Halieaceae bacterium]|nr:tRNA adenosine(34) deaminase TadA [Halieaceae bacterium]
MPATEHELWMKRALELAESAASANEVPVGAVLVRAGELLGEGRNQMISSNDPTAHAEQVALRNAASKQANFRLPGSTLYVTLEPCTMCVGAMLHARVEKLIFAAREPRAGVVCSRARLLDEEFYNHRIEWEEGLLADESAQLLQAFFRIRR